MVYKQHYLMRSIYAFVNVGAVGQEEHALAQSPIPALALHHERRPKVTMMDPKRAMYEIGRRDNVELRAERQSRRRLGRGTQSN